MFEVIPYALINQLQCSSMVAPPMEVKVPIPTVVNIGDKDLKKGKKEQFESAEVILWEKS